MRSPSSRRRRDRSLSAKYSFTDRELADELAVLARRGVRICIYRAREQFQQELRSGSVTTTGTLLVARDRGPVKSGRDLMHLKSSAIAGRLLRTDSANCSPTGLKRQDNDVSYESSTEAAERFGLKFAEMWQRPTNASASASELQDGPDFPALLEQAGTSTV